MPSVTTIRREIPVGAATPTGLMSFSLPNGGSVAYELAGRRHTAERVTPGSEFFFAPQRFLSASGRVLGHFRI